MSKMNRKQLQKVIIQEMKKMNMSFHESIEGIGMQPAQYGSTSGAIMPPKTRNPFATSAADPSPFEYKLADVIASTWEQHTLGQPNQPSDSRTWPMEVDRAAAHLEEAIMDSGLLNDLFRLIGDIEDGLHDGDFHPDSGIRSQIPR